LAMGKFRYKILQNEPDLEYLKTHEHYVSPNYVGFTYLLVFFKRNVGGQDTYHSYFIDRKTLKYNKEHLKLDEINIYPVKIKAHVDIYEGTILDGISIFTPDRKKVFMVTDVYFLAGSDLTHDDLKYKLINFTQYIENKIIHDPHVTHVMFQTNKLYAYTELKQLVYQDMPTCGLKTRGLVFYPKLSGTKMLYNFPPDKKGDKPDRPDRPVKPDKNDFADLAYTGRRDIIKTESPEPKTEVIKKPLPTEIDKPVHANFAVKKTVLPDVYELYLRDGKTLKKQGIAYIPSQKSSHFCKSAFENAGADQLIMRCDYSAEFQKWTPYKVMRNKTRPEKISHVDKKLGIV
jgi:hypothetical protein